MTEAPEPSLLPKEHGAWFQLMVPLGTVLAVGSLSVPALALTVGAVAVFIAHEPLLVALGHRGARRRARDGDRARRLLRRLSIVAAAAGAAGLWLSPATVWPSLLAVVVPSAALIPLIRRRRERTTPGELLASLGLVGVCLPVALAGDVPERAATSIWLLWSAAFMILTLTVRGVLAAASKSRRSRRLRWISAALAAAAQGSLIALSAAAVVPTGLAWAFAPVTAFAWGIAARDPGARSLRVVGLSMAASSVLSAVVIVVSLAHPQ